MYNTYEWVLGVAQLNSGWQKAGQFLLLAFFCAELCQVFVKRHSEVCHRLCRVSSSTSGTSGKSFELKSIPKLIKVVKWTWCWGKRVLKEFCWSDDEAESLKDWWQYLKASPVTCEISSDVAGDSLVIDPSFSTSSSSQEPKITCSFHWPHRHHIIIEDFVMCLLLIFHIGPGQHMHYFSCLNCFQHPPPHPQHHPHVKVFITALLTVWSVIRHTWNLWCCDLSSAGINHATLPGTYSTRWGRQIIKYIFWVVTEQCDIFHLAWTSTVDMGSKTVKDSCIELKVTK